MEKTDIAKALGSAGGQALAAQWRDLQTRADAGDPEALRELARRKRAMRKRGRKGGRPRREAEDGNE